MIKLCQFATTNLTLPVILPILLASMPTPGNSQSIEQLTTLKDQTHIAVTIYNENLALIKDQRNVTLKLGSNQLAFRGVSAQMRPETAILRSLTHGKGFKIIEQNFDYDLLTPQKLLEKHLGQNVKIITTNPATGIETISKATVLSTNQGVVLKIGNRIESNPKGRFIFENIPKNLRDQPTLNTQLISPIADPQQLELSYLSGGLSWKADYVAELNREDSELDLIGWVTLNNESGADYKEAKLQLVAGDVNRIKDEYRAKNKVKKMAMTAIAEDSSMAEESLFEYHLYSLDRPTTISNRQTKQVSLLAATSVPVRKELLLQGADYYYRNSYGDIGQKIKIGVFVEFQNHQKSGLGTPIPKGIVRVYKKDRSGNAQFIGEDRIDHTPKNEKIRLKLGDAFDVTASKKQVDFKKRSHSDPYNYAFESAFHIELKNAKAEPVTIVVREPIPGDWNMIEDTHNHKKIAAGTAEWQINVPAESTQKLDYRVLVRY
ncbi:MAG: DUF4139 domain-containing protein [Methylococcales bacterium]